MMLSKLLKVTMLSFLLTCHNAYAMDPQDIPGITKSIKINLPEYEKGKSWSVTVESQNLFMRSTTEEDLDYYFQIFSNKIAMEQYMQGIPRPYDEIIGRHKKYLGYWQDGNPFSSYLTFLNEDASRKFLSEQEKLIQLFNDYLSSFPIEKIPFKDETLGYQISLKSLKKEFERNKKIFIGHVMLEPGEDRNLKTDAEVSYVFLPAFWRRGYATEAVGNLLELSKIFLAKKIPLGSHLIDTLIATASESNIGSCRVLEKNNFATFQVEEKFGAIRRLYTLSLENKL